MVITVNGGESLTLVLAKNGSTITASVKDSETSGGAETPGSGEGKVTIPTNAPQFEKAQNRNGSDYWKLTFSGNKKMMESIGAQWHDCNQVGTIIHVAIDGKYAGHIVINDTLKEGSAHAIRELKELGVEKTVMLTGDRREVGEDVAHKLGLDECRAELLPTDKVSHVEQLLKTKTAGKTLAYVGDGINDAPVLKRADVGIAMGGLGSDAAIEAADVVLMDDDPRKIALAVKIARRTIHIAHENVVFAIGVKVAVLILATIGLGTMWMAVFADVGVTVLAVLNAMRSLGKNRLFYR